MVNFFGQICLVIALITSLIQTMGVVPHNIARLGRPACQTTALFVLSAFITLALGFILNIDSLQVVQENSIMTAPWYIRLTGLWNNHSSIMLVWMMFFSGFSSLYVIHSKHRNVDHLSRPVIGVQGFIQSGFLLYMVVFVSPFTTYKGGSFSLGDNMNIASFNHVLIYAAYMLISIVYALVIGILIEGKRVSLLTQEALPWLKPSWALLTLGVMWGLTNGYLHNGHLVIVKGTVEYSAVITLGLMTALLVLSHYIEHSRVVKKLVLLVGILAFFQGVFGSLINQRVSMLRNEVLITELPESKFLFLFIGFGITFSLMVYLSRVIRSLKKNKAALSHE